ncbi:MAG: 2-oxo acid dehydrogenase subunit E2 [Chloroflexi bacterium]|nr:2-oxo acid dehydrogenase subunit E2 [Chloroflexota bacterium]
MPTAVIMPKFEMAQETGKVAAWVKAEGDVVKKGDVILEVETDKVNMEVEALVAGVLTGIAVRAGEIVPIGQAIAFIVKPGESFSGVGPVPAAQAAAGAAQPASSRPAAAASPLAVRLAESLGVDLAVVKGTGPRGQVTREDVEACAASQQAASAPSDGKVRAVPAARRLARELGVDLHQVRGTGPEGRIQPEDVRSHLEAVAIKQTVVATPTKPVAVQPEPAVAPIPQGGFALALPGSPAIRRLVPLTNIRRTIAERMTVSVREAPQFTVGLDADMTRALAVVEDLRGGDAAGNQPRVTLTALLIKACAWALYQHPGANAAYQDGQIAEWGEVNVGVATAIETGLIVPVIRQADQLGMRAIAARLADVTTRARGGQLKIEDLQGGTFTLSNLGMFGIDHFTAILNPPQAAILAVGRVAKRAVVLADDRIEVRPMTTLTLTADHRVLDGVTAAQFLATIQRILEHPGLLLE